MNSVVILMTLVLCLTVSAEWAAADADSRASLDRKEKAIRAWQSGQNQQFKAVDREADRLLRRLKMGPGSTEKAPSSGAVGGK
jgi:hypothetical protein